MMRNTSLVINIANSLNPESTQSSRVDLRTRDRLTRCTDRGQVMEIMRLLHDNVEMSARMQNTNRIMNQALGYISCSWITTVMQKNYLIDEKLITALIFHTEETIRAIDVFLRQLRDAHNLLYFSKNPTA